MCKKINRDGEAAIARKKVLKYFALPSASCKSNIDDKII